MKHYIIFALVCGFYFNAFSQNKDKAKYQEDVKAIKAMAGIYKVSFDFAETFAPDTAYKYHKRYREWGIEYVTVIEDTPNKISLQHLLIINDSTIIKHWRQDWIYEGTEMLTFLKDDEWIKTKLNPQDMKGRWLQKVYQVDDSPRYEGAGTWVHADGRHFWESTSDSPLPRREFTKRNDYNVLRRHSHIEITSEGWYLEQDNEKIIRNGGTDKMLCGEKGMEKFTKGNYTALPAIKWWKQNEAYWANVRKAWEQIYAQHTVISISKQKGLLWEKLFQMGEQKASASQSEILEAIKSYLKTS
jgi:hypothetical protein